MKQSKHRSVSQAYWVLYDSLPILLPDLEHDQIIAVLDAYEEPWRTYHNCGHILNMTNLLTEVGDSEFSELEMQAIQYMILYHDVVYKLGREKGWNETRSAEYAWADLKDLPGHRAFAMLVVKGIRVSENHLIHNGVVDIEEKDRNVVGFFLDLDLATGLGSNWEEFSANTKLIEQEYSPLYTTEEYAIGRKKWAEGFLQRDRIFRTDHFAHLEKIARINLARLIDES